MRNLKNYSFLFNKKSKIYISICLISALITSLTYITSTLYISKCIGYLIGKHNVNFTLLGKNLFILFILFLVNSLFTWVLSIISNKFANKLITNLRITLFNKLNKIPIFYFETTSIGNIISIFTNDINNVGDTISVSIISLFSGIVTIIICLIIMLYLNVKITLLVLFVTAFNFLVTYITSRISKPIFASQQQIIGDLTSFTSDVIGNQKLIIALNGESEKLSIFENINNNFFHTVKNAMFISAITNPVTRFLENFSYLLIGIFGGIITINDGLSIGIISAFLIYSAQFSKPFNEISSIITNIQTGFASLDRIIYFLNLKEDNENNKTEKLPENLESKINFNNVCFSYIKDKPLIENLNFSVNPNDTIAIVGPTGAGKTTIANLLMRFYEIDKGNILIDNIDINKISKNNLRSHIGMVLQDTWLFSGTIKENIMYSNSKGSEEDMVKASKIANAHTFISNLEKGYDTYISTQNNILSEGEKQLISIARTIFANPDILILDEATSSIDTLTEIKIQEAFNKIMKNKTSFVIAHRLSTIQNATKILVLNKGKIIEIGSHNELLEKKGFYYNLYNSQFE